MNGPCSTSSKIRIRVSSALVVVAFSLQTAGCPFLVAGAAGGAAAGGAASAQGSEREHHSALTYTGTVLANVPYVPVKIVFAGLGALASGVSYVATLGQSNLPDSIWDGAVKGNYVLTPRMVEGRDTIHFVGPGESRTTTPRA